MKKMIYFDKNKWCMTFFKKPLANVEKFYLDIKMPFCTNAQQN